jgi:pimeloyl-CoA synthetase
MKDIHSYTLLALLSSGLEDGGRTFLQTVCNNLHDYIASLTHKVKNLIYVCNNIG